MSGGNGNGWDLTSKRSLDSCAEWVRKGSGAILVLVIRGEDMSFAVDGRLRPLDAITMVELVLPELETQLAEERARKAEDARLKAMREQQRAAARYVSDAKKGGR